MLAMHLTQIRLAGYESVMNVSSPANDPRREATGFLVAAAFVLLAAVRDVYLGGLFQRITPFLIAIVAFSLCTVLFLPVLLGSRRSLASRAASTAWRPALGQHHHRLRLGRIFVCAETH
jgi:hypothetical protein